MQTFTRFRFPILFVAAGIASLFLVAAFRFQTNRRFAHLFAKPSLARRAKLPQVILWAWERPEHLDFINPQNTGIAYLAKTIHLRGDRAVKRPRFQPLTTPPGAIIVPVVRIEVDRIEAPTLSSQQIKDTATEISELGKLPTTRMIQIDFDARVSERQFYRDLLNELRSRLPASTSISITALASWCQGDNWLDDLPVDEAVPMLFRLGVERPQFLAQVAAGAGFNSKKCQNSAGISTDEPLAQFQNPGRVYVFNPSVWNEKTVNQILETYEDK